MGAGNSKTSQSLSSQREYFTESGCSVEPGSATFEGFRCVLCLPYHFFISSKPSPTRCFLVEKMDSTLLIPSPNSRSISLKEGLVGKERVCCSHSGRRESRLQQLDVLASCGLLFLLLFVFCGWGSLQYADAHQYLGFAVSSSRVIIGWHNAPIVPQ